MADHAVDLTADSDATASATSEDDDLQRAIALSLAEEDTSPKPTNPSSTSNINGRGTVVDPPIKSPPTMQAESRLGGILGVDRKRQEQERLARLKRKRSVSPPAMRRNPKVDREKGTNVGNHGLQDRGKAPVPAASTPMNGSPTLQYPIGVFKKTWAFGYPRQGDDIKIEELLQKADLEAAVLSSFQWEYDWLFPKLDTTRTKFVLVVQAKEASTRHEITSDFARIPNVRLCFPPMQGQVNCMHSKLMLLFYATHLRVVVPTANLVSFDWGEAGGVMENTVFLIDLPKYRDDGGAAAKPTPFFEDLMVFLKAMKLQDDVLRRIQEYDFSQASHLGFVHTIGGAHADDAWRLTGLCGLGRTIGVLGLQTLNPLQMDFVTSSVGSLTDEFLRSMYLAVQGDDGLTEFTLRNSKSFPAKCVGEPQRTVEKGRGSEWKGNLRIYFPSEQTVKASKGGPQSAGTICLQPRWWNGIGFPRSSMRDCESRRLGLLMHNKVRVSLLVACGLWVTWCRSCLHDLQLPL